MNDMMDPQAVYGSVDPTHQQNPYAAFQAVSGAKLTPAGPAQQQDPTGYGNNSPTFYTDQLRSMNNAGPPSYYQPMPPNTGYGISSGPSQFTPAYFLLIHNRTEKTYRVSAGRFQPNDTLVFAQPRSVDDCVNLEFPQADKGARLPVLVELPSKALYFRMLTVPGAPSPNQSALYLPLESEISTKPSATFDGKPVYADTPAELHVILKYLSQFGTVTAPSRTGHDAGSIATGPGSSLPPSRSDLAKTMRSEAATAPAPVTPDPAVAQAQARAVQQQNQLHQAQLAQQAKEKSAQASRSLMISALLLGAGIVASKYMRDR
jgi:hypothetical protein